MIRIFNIGVVMFVALSAMAQAPTTAPAIEGAFQGGGPLLGVAPAIAPPPMKLRWTYKTNTAERAGVDGCPVIVGNTVYIADNLTTLHAVDLATGKARWTYKTEDGFVTTPLVVDGKVLIGDQGGTFHAVSAETGKKLWTANLETGMHSSANAAGNRILVGTDGAEIFCLNLADGKQLWKAMAGDRVNAAASVGHGMAFFSGCDANLRGFDLEKGAEKFAVELGAVAPGSAVLVGGRAVVGTDQGKVLCIQVWPEPKQLWVYDKVRNEAMVYSTPAVAEGVVVVGARDKSVHAIDLQTGQQKWVFPTRGDVDAAPMISGGRVYVGSKDRRLYVLDLKTGKSLWQFAAARSIDGGVAIGSGVLVFGDSGGSVYCLERR